jgi:hypothetical protein
MKFFLCLLLFFQFVQAPFDADNFLNDAPPRRSLNRDAGENARLAKEQFGRNKKLTRVRDQVSSKSDQLIFWLIKQKKNSRLLL